MKDIEAAYKIKKINDKKDLLALWEAVLRGNTTPEWPDGWAFQYLIIRAFEIEGAEVIYPFPVKMDNQTIEEIDGLVYLKEYNLYILLESKNQDKPQNIAPIAKLRNQLMRRPSNSIGAIFSTSGFTDPALLLGQFLAPQTILFWEQPEIQLALENDYFIKGTVLKYKYSVRGEIAKFVINKKDII